VAFLPGCRQLLAAGSTWDRNTFLRNPSHEELCQQRGAFFYQHRSRVGVACAQACALRIGGAAPPRRQAPLQGANVHALQEDLDAHWGG
jgi:hypothetical protein